MHLYEHIWHSAEKQEHFAHAIGFLKNYFKDLLEETETNTIENTTTTASQFGVFLYELEQIKERGELLQLIEERQIEIQKQKERWRPFIEYKKMGSTFYEVIEISLREGKLIPENEGCGGAYFFEDGQGITRFVIKPVDEDIFCLNNRKEFASPFNDTRHRARDAIPLYRSAQTDALCYEVALLAGLKNVTPRAVMALVESDQFDDGEKLCSIQEFIPDSVDLFDLMHEFYAQNLSDEEIASYFDQKNFEQIFLFLWLTYENDGHGGNFLTFVKRIDETGKKIYGLKKIDNSLSFPQKNTQYFNMLTWSLNANQPLSEDLKQKIARLPVEKILEVMNIYDMADCTNAFCERVEIIQSLAQKEKMTLAEMDIRLGFLDKENGRDLALKSLSTQDIIDQYRTKL